MEKAQINYIKDDLKSLLYKARLIFMIKLGKGYIIGL